jgi:abhydrolase domain-containing protein 12
VYRSYASLGPQTHLIAFSYRGFGRSTGSPTEQGLIIDGTTIVNYCIDSLAMPPSRIALVGQSLGTAVLSGVVEQLLASPTDGHIRVKEDFAVILLICGFTNLKMLLLEYRMGGVIPILAPLAYIPGLQKLLQKVVFETWESQTRLQSAVQTAFVDPDIERKLNIQLIHALDDGDIPFRQSVSNYEALLFAGTEFSSGETVSQSAGSVDEGDIKRSAQWEDDRVKIGLRVVRSGGKFASDQDLSKANRT